MFNLFHLIVTTTAVLLRLQSIIPSRQLFTGSSRVRDANRATSLVVGFSFSNTIPSRRRIQRYRAVVGPWIMFQLNWMGIYTESNNKRRSLPLHDDGALGQYYAYASFFTVHDANHPSLLHFGQSTPFFSHTVLHPILEPITEATSVPRYPATVVVLDSYVRAQLTPSPMILPDTKARSCEQDNQLWNIVTVAQTWGP